MSLYIQVPIQQIADGLTAIGWSSAGGGGDATLSYGSTVPATPVNGTLWYDTTATLLKLYTGGTWTTINVSAETIATISGYATTAQVSANTATQKLTEFKAIQVTATTLSAGASATASYNSGTGVITLGIPTGATGIKGVDGEVSTAQLNTAISGITKISLGLSNVDNTSDENKPVSVATQTALNLKADATALTTKQDTLVSGTNIKTIGGASILGDGDMVVGGATDYQEFTTSGTWTKPAGCNFVYVQILGGGGGGSAYASPSGTLQAQGGSGGNAFHSLYSAIDIQNTVEVIVGAGGAGGGPITANNAALGGNGGNSSFGDVSVTGGIGGAVTDNQAFTGSFVGTAFGGEKLYKGIYGGGRGGAALLSSVNTGLASLNAGSGGDGALSTTTTLIGNSGNFPAGGGGGARQTASNTSVTGGAGAAGVVRVWTW